MEKINLSTKRLQISKANTTITMVVAAAAFLTVTSLMTARAMLQQRSYLDRVIKEKKIATTTLNANIKATESLMASYEEFVNQDQNMIGGGKAGEGERDGDNAKITLDALPSKYDFPALTASLEKITSKYNFQLEKIEGTDDEIAQQAKEQESQPEVVEMPFKFTVKGNYDPLYDLIRALERSIRPVQAQRLVFTASEGSVELQMEAKTFYQPEQSLKITTKEVQ